MNNNKIKRMVCFFCIISFINNLLPQDNNQNYFSCANIKQYTKNTFQIEKHVLGKFYLGPCILDYCIENNIVYVYGSVEYINKSIDSVEIYICNKIKRKKNNKIEFKIIRFLGYNNFEYKLLQNKNKYDKYLCDTINMFSVKYIHKKEYLIFWHSKIKKGAVFYLDDNL